MKETAPQFEQQVYRVGEKPGKLSFGRDLDKIAGGIEQLRRGVLPPESPPGSFGFGDGSAWSRVYVVYITEAETGIGKYKCTMFAPFGSDNLSDPEVDFSDDAISSGETIEENALYLNLPEFGASSGHVLTDSGNAGSLYGLALLVDQTDDNRSVLVGQMYREEDC